MALTADGSRICNGSRVALAAINANFTLVAKTDKIIYAAGVRMAAVGDRMRAGRTPAQGQTNFLWRRVGGTLAALTNTSEVRRTQAVGDTVLVDGTTLANANKRTTQTATSIASARECEATHDQPVTHEVAAEVANPDSTEMQIGLDFGIALDNQQYEFAVNWEHDAGNTQIIYAAKISTPAVGGVVNTRTITESLLAADVRRSVRGGVLREAILLRETLTQRSSAAALTDNFDDNLRDSTKWAESSVLRDVSTTAVTVSETNQQLKITRDPFLPNAGFRGYSSTALWDFTGSQVRVEVVEVGPTHDSAVETFLILGPAGGVWTAIIVAGNTLKFERTDPLVSSSIAYDPEVHHHWRIRHDTVDDTFRYETSVDGLTWTQRESFARTFNITEVKIELIAGLTGNVGNPGFAVFDNFNTTVSQVFPRKRVDTTLLSDARQLERNIHARDALALTDQARGQAERLQKILDAVLLTDATRQQADRNLRVTDAMPVSDALRRTFEAQRLVADILTLADAFKREQHLRLLESLFLSDQNRQQTNRAATIIDRLLLDDRAMQQVDRRREILERLLLADTTRQEAMRLRRLLDAILLADLFTATFVPGAAGAVVHERLIQEGLRMVDAPQREEHLHMLESMLLSDQARQQAERRREILDFLLLSDVSRVRAERLRSIADNILLADTTEILAIRNRLVIDALLLADRIVEGHDVQLREALVLSDAASKLVERFRTVSDVLLILDLASTQAQRQRGVADAIPLSDVARTQAERLRTLAELLVLSDTFTADKISQAVQVVSRLIQDALALADFRSSLRVTHIVEAVILRDTAARQADLRRAITDAVVLQDSTLTQSDRIRLIADQIGLSEADRRTIEKVLREPAGIPMSDVASTQAQRQRAIADVLVILDSTLTQSERLRLISDPLALSDALSATRFLVRSILDALLISDAITAEKILAAVGAVFTRTVQDAMVLADRLVKARELRFTDQIAIADKLDSLALRLRLISDVLALVDTASAQATRMRVIADRMIVEDAVRKLRELILREPLNILDVFRQIVVAAVVEMLTDIKVLTVDPLGRATDVWFRDPIGRDMGGKTLDLLGRTLGWRNT